MDPTVIRVLWLVAVLCAGTGILAYIILWIVLPLAPAGVIPTSAAAAFRRLAQIKQRKIQK